MTVSLDDFLRYLLKKWKVIVAFFVIFVLLFLASAKIFGEKIAIQPSEEYLQLREQEVSFAEYIENSPIMKINATNVCESTIYISNIVERDSLKNYIESGAVWSQLEDENFKKYFSDLVTWYDNGNGFAEIIIQHYDEQQSRDLAEYLSESILKYDETLSVLQGDLRVASDESIAEVQSWYKNRMNAIEGQLEYARAGYTIEVSLPVAIVTGTFVGGFSAIVLLFICFWFDNRKMQQRL